MRLAIILGRGVEGCGVTKYTVEMSKYLDTNNYEHRIFASLDKKWGRRNAHELNHLTEIKFAEGCDDMINYCNSCDAVIINSLPAKSHSDEMVFNYVDFLYSLEVPIILIQHDHNVHSIIRNAALEESVKAADIIFCHALNNDFSKKIASYREAPLHTFQPGLDFDSLRAKYWKPVEEVRTNIHLWTGRNTSWKGYRLMLDFHENSLVHIDASAILCGIEKSISFAGWKNEYDFVDAIKQTVTDDIDFNNSDLPIITGPYNNHDVLEFMSTSGYGYQLSKLKPKYIHKSIEYTHAEIAAIGVIPVFRKSYGDLCLHRTQDIPLTQCKDSGTIWLDHDNMLECLELIEKINADSSLREDYREKAFEFYKGHQDSSYAFTNLFNI